VLPFYFVYRSWSRLKLFQIQMSLNLEKGFENQKRDFISKQPLGPNSRKKPSWPLLIFFFFFLLLPRAAHSGLLSGMWLWPIPPTDPLKIRCDSPCRPNRPSSSSQQGAGDRDWDHHVRNFSPFESNARDCKVESD
jgi:hypothetical protein